LLRDTSYINKHKFLICYYAEAKMDRIEFQGDIESPIKKIILKKNSVNSLSRDNNIKKKTTKGIPEGHRNMSTFTVETKNTNINSNDVSLSNIRKKGRTQSKLKQLNN